MRNLLNLIFTSYFRFKKSDGGFELTAKGPLAVVGLLLVVALSIYFGENLIGLIREW